MTTETTTTAVKLFAAASCREYLESRIVELEEALLQALIMIDESNGETEEDSRNADLWAAFHGVDEE